MASKIKGSKKPKLKECANPIFEQWISEMRNDAIARDLQSKNTYTKCLNSLRKYPLPLNSGKECIILEGFGEKICQIIDKKLEEFLLDGGKLNAQTSNDEINLLKTSNDKIDHKRDEFVYNKNGKRVTESSDEENEENINTHRKVNMLKKSPNKKRIGNNREYMPEFRSGAYALLITLLQDESEKDDDTENKSMLKADLIKAAQKHCDSSFTTSDACNHYTAWSSMSTLTKKNLIIKSNKTPSNYALTEDGRELALKLIDKYNSKEKKSSLSQSSFTQSESSNQISSQISNKPLRRNFECYETNKDDYPRLINKNTDFEPLNLVRTINQYDNKSNAEAKLVESSDSESNDDPIVIHKYSNIEKFGRVPNSKAILQDHSRKPTDSEVLVSLPPKAYEIILLVDTCETTHAKKQELFLKELEKTDIKYEISKLNIGDFTWIARSNFSTSFQNTDLILDYIVERKRVDDLCQSIIDGRYKEQKFRLKRSGINNIIYLIEHFGSMKNFSLPEASIKQAIINTQIIDDFLVKETQNVKDSVSYLVEMTKYLIEFYNGITLNGCLKEKLDEYYGKYPLKLERETPHNYLMTFQEFNQNSNKNKPPTVKEMFGRCLIQINGLSQDKCISILENYPTPSHLFNAYESCESESARHKLLANLKCGKQMRNLGPSLSKLFAMVFYTKTN